MALRSPERNSRSETALTSNVKNQPHALVLIVEDEADLAEMLRVNLQREGYRCKVMSSGERVFEHVRREPPDLILLDRMLPGIAGDEIVARIKRDPATASIPIILLTAKAEETDQLVGFALGADDYVTKPFSVKLLLARVGAVLRRAESGDAEGDLLEVGPVRMNLGRHEVAAHEQPVQLTATEFKLLKALMSARGRVLSRAQLLDTIFGKDVVVTDRTIDVHITALRKKLGESAAWVQTVRGVGYTYREP